MSDTKKVQEVRERMLLIYGEICWMGYKATRKNQYTYHHIQEARDGGKVKIENGAILTRYAHDDLNEMDNHYKECYKDLNILFSELNQTMKPPTKEYWIELKNTLLIASKKINLSNLYDPNIDPIMLEEFSYMTSEERQKIETSEGYYEPTIYVVDYSHIIKSNHEKLGKSEPYISAKKQKILKQEKIEKEREIEQEYKKLLKHKTRFQKIL